MQDKKIMRRRGTSVAAAALSFALVVPFAQPVVAPTVAAQAFAKEADGSDVVRDDGWLRVKGQKVCLVSACRGG